MNFGLNLWSKAVCRIHGSVVIEGMNLSVHPLIINEIIQTSISIPSKYNRLQNQVSGIELVETHPKSPYLLHFAQTIYKFPRTKLSRYQHFCSSQVAEILARGTEERKKVFSAFHLKLASLRWSISVLVSDCWFMHHVVNFKMRQK